MIISLYVDAITSIHRSPDMSSSLTNYFTAPAGHTNEFGVTDKMEIDELPYELMDLDVEPALDAAHPTNGSGFGIAAGAPEGTMPVPNLKLAQRPVTRQKPAYRPLTCRRPRMKRSRSILMPDVIPTAPPWSKIMPNLLSRGPRTIGSSAWVGVRHCWRLMLQNSVMAGDIYQVQAAFRFVDNIADTSEMYWLSRGAYLHLTRMLAYLSSTIKADRESGRMHLTIGRGNASLALEAYCQSQSSESDKEALKRIKRRLRIARRWTDLTGGSLLLVFAYSNKAETVVRNFAVTNRTLRSVASNSFALFPQELTKASCELMQLSDQAIRGLLTESQIDLAFHKLETVLFQAGLLESGDWCDNIL
ncbi:hypothetical protein LZ30DRAFT_348843 [Colletotrichum cereale]|nr:hypothetical protein LZ30DRAFT_348843 [Colletotrichum cereale]